MMETPLPAPPPPLHLDLPAILYGSQCHLARIPDPLCPPPRAQSFLSPCAPLRSPGLLMSQVAGGRWLRWPRLLSSLAVSGEEEESRSVRSSHLPSCQYRLGRARGSTDRGEGRGSVSVHQDPAISMSEHTLHCHLPSIIHPPHTQHTDCPCPATLRLQGLNPPTDKTGYRDRQETDIHSRSMD